MQATCTPLKLCRGTYEGGDQVGKDAFLSQIILLVLLTGRGRLSVVGSTTLVFFQLAGPDMSAFLGVRALLCLSIREGHMPLQVRRGLFEGGLRGEG